jgi:hypothetical protein
MISVRADIERQNADRKLKDSHVLTKIRLIQREMNSAENMVEEMKESAMKKTSTLTKGHHLSREISKLRLEEKTALAGERELRSSLRVIEDDVSYLHGKVQAMREAEMRLMHKQRVESSKADEQDVIIRHLEQVIWRFLNFPPLVL